MLHQNQTKPTSLASCMQQAERSIDLLEHYLTNEPKERVLPCFYYSASKLTECTQSQQLHQHQSAHQSIYRLSIRLTERLRVFLGNNAPAMVPYQLTKSLHERAAVREIERITQTVLVSTNSCRALGELQLIKSNNKRSSAELTRDHQPQTPVDVGLVSQLPQHSTLTPKANKALQETPMTKLGTTSGKTQEQQFLQLYEDCLSEYNDHIMDVAYEKSLPAFELLRKIDPTRQLYPIHHKKLEEIAFEQSEMLSYVRRFEQEQWKFDKSENGVSLYYQLYEAEKQISVLIQSQLNISVENFMAMLCQMDLFEGYVPFCYDCHEMKRISRNEAIGHSKLYVPMLTDRQTYFYAVGYDRMQHNGSLFFYSKTINEDKRYQQKYDFTVPPANSKYIRLEYNFFIVEYRPIAKDSAKVRIGMNVDLRMNYLPNWILSISARKFAFTYFVNIMKCQKNFHKTAWAQKIRENPQLYQFFREKIDRYLMANR